MIYDELVAHYGPPRRDSSRDWFERPHGREPRHAPPAPLRDIPSVNPAEFVLIHRHLDEVTGQFAARFHALEAHLMAAIDDLNAQLDTLESTNDQARDVLGKLVDLVETGTADPGTPNDQVETAAHRAQSLIASLQKTISDAQGALPGDPLSVSTAAAAPANDGGQPLPQNDPSAPSSLFGTSQA